MAGVLRLCQLVDNLEDWRRLSVSLDEVARPLRLEVENGIYHVTSRGNERKAIYRDNADRERFLEVLGQTVERFAWGCLSYCLMDNHYHLLIRTPQPTLSRGVRDLNGIYAQWFNRRHGRDGHLFQGRFRAILVETDEHLLAAVAYIVRNPLRAGLRTSPRDWRWSSHLAAVGEQPPWFLAVDELVSYFGSDKASARKQYCELTERHELGDSSAIHEGVIAGSDEFVQLHLAGAKATPEIPAAHVRPPRPQLEEIFVGVITVEAIATAYEHGYSMPAIARHLGLHPSTVSRRRAQIKT